jgi:hypothetical protein
MGRKTELNIEETAQIMKKDPQYVRYGLQQGTLKFGSAAQKPNGRWSYNLVFRAFCEYMRMPEEEMHKRIDLIREERRIRQNANS